MVVELDRGFLINKYGREQLQQLTEITLCCYSIRKIEVNSFKGLIKLKTLSLYENKIEHIDSRLFNYKRYEAPNLIELNLWNNQLRRIDSITFIGLPNLRILSLCFNQIEELHPNAFEGLSNLKELRLNNNCLGEIERKCFEPLKSIEVIELYGNNNKYISFLYPSTSCYYNEEKLKKYRCLSKWDQFLQQFPYELGKIKKLIRFDLYAFNIRTIKSR